MTEPTVAARGSLSPDTRRVLAAQALRAFAYGLGAVLLGSTLEQLRLSPFRAGLVLAAVVGAVTASFVIARHGDAWGRRSTYCGLYLLLAATGVVFAFATRWWVLAIVALGGALSTEVVESGPFTSIEQAMLATDLKRHELARGFSVYNAVAAAAGSVGALAAGLPTLVGGVWDAAPAEQRWFLILVPTALAGAAIAGSLSAAVEPVTDGPMDTRGRRALGPSRPMVFRLAGLFAIDSFAGGFAVSAFIAYWFAHRFDTPAATLGVIFAVVGVLQTLSFLAAGRLAQRYGLLTTMVATHLPSNVLLAALAFAPSFGVAVGLLLARVALSQMDVPTRQAYVMALVTPGERTAAAATTNSARYLTRPFGALLGGIVGSVAVGAPFVIAGSIKSVYDLVLWRWFRTVPLPEGRAAVIVCLRTVHVPVDERTRYLAWIAEGRAVREAHGILAELVLEPSADEGETIVVTVWPDHETFDAWIATPERDTLTASDVHQAVEYRPITRYEIAGGYLDLAALAAGPDTFHAPRRRV